MFNSNKIKSLFGNFLNNEDTKEIAEELPEAKQVQDTEKTTSVKKSDEEFNIDKFLTDNPRAQKLYNSLFSIKQKEYYYSRKLQKMELVKSKSDLVDLIALDFPEFVGIFEKGAKKGKRYCKIDSQFFSACFFQNSIYTVIKKVNLFQDEVTFIECIGNTLYVYNNFHDFVQPKPLDINTAVYNEVIEDYQKHFQELNDILAWIVACRFTDNRRQSYLHLQLPAGFGKSFFKGALSAIGMSTECRYDDFKSPTSLKSQEFENSLCMIIDEFTVFKKEFKDYTNNMILDAKYEPRTQVELFSKIFLSAETSNSFTGGIDSQILDRLNLIDKSSSIKLENRKKYAQYGNKIYFNCVKQYIYKIISEKLDYYIKLGEIESSNQAEQIIKSFYKKHKLRAENIIDEIKVNFYTKIYELYDADEYYLTNTDVKIKKNIITTLEYIHIKQVKATFEDIIKCFGEDFYKKARYKINNFEEMFDLEVKNYKVKGKTVRCVRINKADFIDVFENHSENLKDNIDLINSPF